MDGFSKYHFKDFGEDEKIIMVIHRNWFYLFEQFFWLIVVSGLFLFGITSAPVYFPDILASANQPVILFAQNFFMLAVWIYAFLIWIDYYFDLWIITNHRIVNIEQKGMFTRKVSETTYGKVQDITTNVSGMLPTMLNFGDLTVQTAGETDDFIFRTISDPYHVKNIIAQMQQKSAASSTERLGEMIKEKMSGE